MTNTNSVQVLIPGNIHERVTARVSETFDARWIKNSDPAFLTPDVTEGVRGLAVGTRITAEFIDAFPELEIIASFGVGYDSIDAAHAAKKGIVVTNTPDVLSAEVADTTIGLLLNTVRELSVSEAYLRAGLWKTKGNYPLTPLTLRDRTVGIFGLGRIGLEIAKRLEGFDVEIAYHSRNKRDDVAYRYAPTLKDLAESVDTLIVIVPGGAATENAVDAEILSALGVNGVLINVGRGSTVDHDALANALENGTIAAAGLDVFPDEPNVPERLLELPNVCVLPHVASASVHTRNAMADLVVDNLISWFEKGEAISPVAECAGLSPKPKG